MVSRTSSVVLLALALVVLAPVPVRAQRSAAPAASVSSTAVRVYQAARSKLLQIRTVLAASDRQTTLGSAFLVDDNGLAITNYHVVSQYVLEPDLYRLEYFTAGGEHGGLQLLGFDLANDLAVVRIAHPLPGHFAFDPRQLADLTKGEQLYAMGNPLDIGFAIVEGTYNGLVERSYTPRIHFSGAINPGMSGGPAVTADGAVVGINVATRLGGELVSFLVPAQYATALVASVAQQKAPPSPAALRADVGRQIAARQAALYANLSHAGFQTARFGPYAAAESKAGWFTCWSQTNAEQVPKPRATIDATRCSSDSDLFVADDLSVGQLAISYAYVHSVDLNAFQFANYLAKLDNVLWLSGWREKWFTPPRCTQDFLAAAPGSGPPVEAVWCARAYKEFPDLYDVATLSVTQDRNNEALVSRFTLQAVTYEDAVALSRKFFAALQWHK